MLMAIIFCGFGYAEGGVLSKKNWWMAGHLLGAYFVTTFYAISDYFLYASFISEHIYISFSRSYLCVFI